MEACVGEISSHRNLADRIARSLWAWSTPEALLTGFTDALVGVMQGSKVAENQDTARFVLTLADQPGQIMTDWSPSECEDLLAQDHRFPGAPARGALRCPGHTRLPRGRHGRRTVVKVSAASPAECGELAVRTLDVDDAADLFSAEGLTASLRRAASFLCPASPRQLIDAVLDAVRPLQPGGDLSRRDLADLLDLLVSGGDLLELRQSGDTPGACSTSGRPPTSSGARASTCCSASAPSARRSSAPTSRERSSTRATRGRSSSPRTGQPRSCRSLACT